ncbi:MAG: SH3 domain-containing protein [Spirochaetia bacterium]|nr:SH3 domain-containing protein [Spirochaetia bacterium]
MNRLQKFSTKHSHTIKYLARMQVLLVPIAFAISVVHAEAPRKGTCFTWSEGDSQSLNDCKAATQQECSKGAKPIDKKATAFQNYKGSLFQKPDTTEILEFRNEPATICKKEIVQAARGSEGTMSSEWGYAVYSEALVPGKKAYVYGTSVSLREKPSTSSNRLATPLDRAEAKILEKSKARDSVPGLYSAYWFKVTVGGKTGWIYGQFLHPDPNSSEPIISN